MNDLYTSYTTVKETNKETNSTIMKNVKKNTNDDHIYASWPKQFNSWANISSFTSSSSSYPPPPSSPPPPLPKQLPLIKRNNKPYNFRKEIIETDF